MEKEKNDVKRDELPEVIDHLHNELVKEADEAVAAVEKLKQQFLKVNNLLLQATI